MQLRPLKFARGWLRCGFSPIRAEINHKADPKKDQDGNKPRPSDGIPCCEFIDEPYESVQVVHGRESRYGSSR
jgi:hypothetical protein